VLASEDTRYEAMGTQIRAWRKAPHSSVKLSEGKHAGCPLMYGLKKLQSTMADRMKRMTKIGQPQTNCFLEAESMVWGLRYQICNHLEEARVACIEFSRGYESKLQRLTREIVVLYAVICQERFEGFPVVIVRY